MVLECCRETKEREMRALIGPVLWLPSQQREREGRACDGSIHSDSWLVRRVGVGVLGVVKY